MQHLFTVVMEIRGTTSVSQFIAEDPDGAIKLWRERLAEPQPYGLSNASAALLLEEALASGQCDVPVPVDGVKNVWCRTVVTGEQLALLNIIKTSC